MVGLESQMSLVKRSLFYCLFTACLVHAQTAKAQVFLDSGRHQADHHNQSRCLRSRRQPSRDESEMRQVQSTLLPQVRLETRVGKERFDQQIIPTPNGNAQWRDSQQYSIVVRQTLFDGFATINEIWRQAARTDAAAMRTYERTELLALDGVRSLPRRRALHSPRRARHAQSAGASRDPEKRRSALCRWPSRRRRSAADARACRGSRGRAVWFPAKSRRGARGAFAKSSASSRIICAGRAAFPICRRRRMRRSRSRSATIRRSARRKPMRTPPSTAIARPPAHSCRASRWKDAATPARTTTIWSDARDELSRQGRLQLGRVPRRPGHVAPERDGRALHREHPAARAAAARCA